MDDVILYIGASSDPELLAYYGHFRQFHSITIKKQHASGKQLKIDSFFQLVHSNLQLSSKLCQYYRFVDFIRKLTIFLLLRC
jgi:hypothetical protein